MNSHSALFIGKSIPLFHALLHTFPGFACIKLSSHLHLMIHKSLPYSRITTQSFAGLVVLLSQKRGNEILSNEVFVFQETRLKNVSKKANAKPAKPSADSGSEKRQQILNGLAY